MYPKTIQKLIDQFRRFPTVGPRTAGRFVFYLLRASKEEVEELTKLISNLSKTVKICSFCFNPHEEEGHLCSICKDARRDRTLICVVEKESDLTSIEKTGKYNGLYFILGGTVPALKKEDVKKIRINELQARIKNPEKFGIKTGFKEIILATNLTTEGEATALYLEKTLKSFNIKISHLMRGLPTGGELEYADEETLGSALEGRK